MGLGPTTRGVDENEGVTASGVNESALGTLRSELRKTTVQTAFQTLPATCAKQTSNPEVMADQTRQSWARRS